MYFSYFHKKFAFKICKISGGAGIAPLDPSNIFNQVFCDRGEQGPGAPQHLEKKEEDK